MKYANGADPLNTMPVVGFKHEGRDALVLCTDGCAGDYELWTVCRTGPDEYDVASIFMAEPREWAALAYPIANAGGGGIQWPCQYVTIDWEYGRDEHGNDCALLVVDLDHQGSAIATETIPIKADALAAAIYGALGI